MFILSPVLVCALKSGAMVVSVLVAVGWKWVPDTNHCNPARGYWLALHCSSRIFGAWDGPREEAEQNHRYNVDSENFLTWTYDSVDVAQPVISPPPQPTVSIQLQQFIDVDDRSLARLS